MGVYFKGYEVTSWDITKSYPIGTVVKYDGREYLAKKDVPVGINIGMSDYWDFGDDERLDNLEEAFDELDATVQNLTLDDLGDVDLDNVNDRDILMYNSETEAFENVPSSSLSTEVSYSTELTKVGTWVDGRNVYRFTYISENYPTNTTIELPEKVTDIIEINGGYESRESASVAGYFVPIFKYNEYGLNVNFATSNANTTYYQTFTLAKGNSVNAGSIHNIRITFTVLLDESEV